MWYANEPGRSISLIGILQIPYLKCNQLKFFKIKYKKVNLREKNCYVFWKQIVHDLQTLIL